MSSSSTPSHSAARSVSGVPRRVRKRDRIKNRLGGFIGWSSSSTASPATAVVPAAPQHLAPTLGIPGTIVAIPGAALPAGAPVLAAGPSSGVFPASPGAPGTVPISVVVPTAAGSPAMGTTVAGTCVTDNQPTGTLSTINMVMGHLTHATSASNTQRNSWEAALAKLSPEVQMGLNVAGPDKLLVLDQVLKQTRGAQDICLQKQWGFSGVADKLVGWVEKFISIGDAIVSFDPVHAALPWAGLRFLLQISIGDKNKMEELLEALEDIANLIGRCAIYEMLYLGNQTTAARCEEAIVDLYAAILLYLFRAKEYYSKNTTVRVFAGTFDTTLKPLLDDVRNKKVIVLEVTNVAEVEYQRLTDGLLAGALDEHKRDFKQLQTLLQQFTSSISRVESDLRVVRDGLEDVERSRILQWISSVEYAKHHRNAAEERVEGTGEWLFQTVDFVAWERSRDSTILWLHGIPGSGKTKLASTVIDRLMRQQEKSSSGSQALAYFYCRRGETGPTNPELVMSAIVKQLSCLKAGLALQTAVLSTYNAKKEAGFSSNSLEFQESLNIIISLTSIYSETYIVIDALDECDPLKRRRFLASLETIIKSSSGLVKIFVSSRDDDDIVRRLHGVPNLWIEAKDNRNDIQRFVEREISRCITQGDLLNGVVEDEMRTRIIKTLIEKSHGMYNSHYPPVSLYRILKSIVRRFLWVALQIHELCAMDVAIDVESRLGSLPEDLENTYAIIYHRIQSQRGSSPQLAKRALMWVMCSCRPFSPDELVTAMSFGFTETGLDASRLFKICHNLLALDRQLNVVRFAHLSVREFLEKSQFTVCEAHTMASECCISNMMEPEAFTKIGALGSSVPYQVYPVRGYPAIYWPTHIQECQYQPDGVTLELRGLLVDFLRKSYPDWYRMSETINRQVENEWQREGAWKKLSYLTFNPKAPLQPAAIFGFQEIVRELWDSEMWDIEATNTYNQTVLVLASRAGFLWIIGMLCGKGADVNGQGGYFGNALQAAATVPGNEEAVELLLQNGADVNAQGGGHGTALQAAASSGNKKTVELLLQNGADINAECEIYGNALQMVELLLRNGADVNAQGGWYGNALQAAAGESGNEKMVELLLQNGADVNAQGGGYGNALQAAAGKSGNEKMVELLLRNGADVNAQGGQYGNALQVAVSSGNKKTVELLLQNGADVNAQSEYYGNALQAAAKWYGNEKMVELLLQHGADDLLLANGAYETFMRT
ncbi:hypothetical protein Q9L58_009028 [Maublancomyces gigas]|uniref:NACHT domain-containing protein n=1 Tax=Discina gigas TaxID=1032678 RepID=A0ABR3G936_9PEZI